MVNALVLPLIGNIQASPQTVIEILPETTAVVSGESFTVDVNISDTVDIAGLQFVLRYDPDILNATDVAMEVSNVEVLLDREFTGVPTVYGIYDCDVVQNGVLDIYDLLAMMLAFASAPGAPNWNPRADIDNNDFVDINDFMILNLAMSATLVDMPGTIQFIGTLEAWEGGTFATVTFEAVGLGETILDLDDVKLGSGSAEPISHEIRDGTVEVWSASLFAVVSDDLNGMYQDILLAIQTELAKIDVALQIVLADPGSAFWDTWDGASINITDYVLSMWDVPGDFDGDGIWEYGVDGWDLTVGEVQLWNLNGLENLTIETPPLGYNIMPWMNDKAEELYYLALGTSDPLLRRDYMWSWQEEFMHDPPMIILYYPVDSAYASIPLWMNLNNPILSNRYVRQSIAHAIPYDTILGTILPGSGVSGIEGKTPVPPIMSEFNTVLEPYEYNITRAQLYMDMWVYSQVGTDYTLGPMGDADFSGYVEMADFVIWAANYGTTSADWTFPPGCDIDPDFNNDDYVNGILGDVNRDLTVDDDDLNEWALAYGSAPGDSNWNSLCDFNRDNIVDDSDLFALCRNYGRSADIDDFTLWQGNIGMYYPERSLTHEWSR